jgi:hypothetical protein
MQPNEMDTNGASDNRNCSQLCSGDGEVLDGSGRDTEQHPVNLTADKPFNQRIRLAFISNFCVLDFGKIHVLVLHQPKDMLVVDGKRLAVLRM